MLILYDINPFLIRYSFVSSPNISTKKNKANQIEWKKKCHVPNIEVILLLFWVHFKYFHGASVGI